MTDLQPSIAQVISSTTTAGSVDLLLGQIDRIIDAPGAISQIRSFLLELAVKGKLVDQSPSDGEASDLLQRIRSEKNKLIKEGKLRRHTGLDTQDLPESLYPLPSNWTWCRLSDVGAIIGGGTPPSGDSDNFTKGGSGIPWLTPADLGKQRTLFVSHGMRDLTPKGLEASSAILMPPGTVLFTSRAPIGYTAIAQKSVSTNQGFKSVVPYQRMSNRFIELYFRAFAKRIDAHASGTTFREVSGKIVSNLSFPLPPLAEQHRIVAKLDELMALCDRLEAAQAEREHRRERLNAASLARMNATGLASETISSYASFHLELLPCLVQQPQDVTSLRLSILDLAISGRLSCLPRGDDENQLTGRTSVESDQSCKNPLKAPALSEMTTLAPVPKGWKWLKLGQMAEEFRYGTSAKCTRDEGGVPVLRIPNVSSGKIELSDLKYGHLTERELKDLRLEVGDILVIRSNGSLNIVGRAALVGKEAVGACYAGYLVRFRLKRTEFEPRYVLLALSSPLVRGQIEKPIRTTVGLKNINTSELSALNFPVPPLAEQRRIVAKVDELMGLCDRLEAALQTSQAESRRLLDALLHAVLSEPREPAAA